MGKKLFLVFVVATLGLRLNVPSAKDGVGWSLEFDGPAIAIALYGTLATVVLFRILNHLPGVFALRRPLGAVRTGYEYLWGAAIPAALANFGYTGVFEGRSDSASRYWTAGYGSRGSSLPLAALCVFAFLMWLLKLRATMADANRRLEQDAS